MHEVIQKVLETEAEAQRLVVGAKAQAEHILAQARQQARELLARAEQETRVESDRLLTEALESAEHQRQEKVAQAASRIRAQLRLDERAVQQAAQAVVRCVCGSGSTSRCAPR